MTPPRATFTTRAPFFIFEKASSLNMPCSSRSSVQRNCELSPSVTKAWLACVAFTEKIAIDPSSSIPSWRSATGQNEEPSVHLAADQHRSEDGSLEL